MEKLKYSYFQTDNSIKLKDALIRCPFVSCGTRIIKVSEPLSQQITQISGYPRMLEFKKLDSNEPKPFFSILDVWEFDNIGVTKPMNKDSDISIEIDGKRVDFRVERLLTCSECDKGPLGFAGFEGTETDIKKLKYFLSCESVIYDTMHKS